MVSNPNVIVAGSIGAGKSTVVKMTLDRALERGRRAVIIDPKGEYAALAQSYGVNVVALGHDGWCDPFPSNYEKVETYCVPSWPVPRERR